MPQLDFNIALPQIFWLIILFIFVYTILVHFFLPNFIKLIKTRKYIILVNEQEVIFLKENLVKKQFIFRKTIQQNFGGLKIVLEKQLSTFFTSPSTTSTISIDTKLVSVLNNSILYYDTTILNLIYLKPSLLDLKV